jgi:hypothetical protein
MVKSWKFVALQILALLLQLALAGAVVQVVGEAETRVTAAEARTVEVAERAAQVREYEWLRGAYAFCIATYGDVAGCNYAVKIAVEQRLYNDPKYVYGFEPPH